MKHTFFDRYSHLDSLVHRLDPRVKIVAALAAIIIVTTESLSGRLVHFAVYAVIILVVTGCSRIPIRYLLKLILLLSPFILMAAIFYPVSQMQIRELTLASDWRPLAEAGLSVFMKAFLALLILIQLNRKISQVTGGTSLAEGAGYCDHPVSVAVPVHFYLVR